MTVNEYIDTIRLEMQKRGYTQEILSEKSGVPKSTINKILCRATGIPRKKTMDKLNEALGIVGIQTELSVDDSLHSLTMSFANYDSSDIKDLSKLLNKAAENNIPLSDILDVMREYILSQTNK